MGLKDISFPGIDLTLKNVPKTFTVFGFEIAMYGIVIAVAMMLAFALCLKLAKDDGQDTETYWDFVIYAVIFAVIGARLYYVIFSWDYYSQDLLKIFDIREGGLAIYGGVIGGFATCFIYCKIKKLNPFRILDVASAGLLVGQILGRWANFFNRECFGGYCDNAFRMLLPENAVRADEITDEMIANIVTVDGIQCISVHPTFLYESLLNVLVLTAYLIYRKHKKFNGELALLYLGGYGLVRFFVEGLRTDQLKFPGTSIAVSQMLGIFLFVGAVVAEIAILMYRKKKGIVNETADGKFTSGDGADVKSGNTEETK